MSFFKKKCEYCKEKIDRGKEIYKDVKVPGFIGIRKKAFCCSEHANAYEKEAEEHLKIKKSCCG